MIEAYDFLNLEAVIHSRYTRIPGADIGSDHDMVLATLKLELKKIHHQKSPRIGFDIEKLKDPELLQMLYSKQP